MKTIKQSILVCFSAIASTVAIASSSYASTSSLSQLSFDLKDFNLIPQENENSNAGDNVVISGNKTSTVTANFDGGLDFIVDNSQNLITGDSKSEATGFGTKYFGLSPLSSQAVGKFSVKANQSFSFDFQSSLNIDNKVTTPANGSVDTLTGASFFLVDNESNAILDFFRLVANVKTNLVGGENQSNKDYLFKEASAGVTFTQAEEQKDFGGLTESAEAIAAGSFTRFFDTPVDFSLYVNTINRSCVQAPMTNNVCTAPIPEPTTIAGAISGFICLGIIQRSRRKRERIFR